MTVSVPTRVMASRIDHEALERDQRESENKRSFDATGGISVGFGIKIAVGVEQVMSHTHGLESQSQTHTLKSQTHRLESQTR